MDKEKKLLHELLQADGIAPGRPTESEQMAFGKILDEQLKTKLSRPESNRLYIWRIIMKNRMTKLTAAAIVIAALILSTQLFPTNPTFAEVIQPIFNARTIIFDYITGMDENSPVIHDIVCGSRIRRTVSNSPHIEMVLDLENARMLHLDDNTKEAVYFDISGPLEEGTRSSLTFLRDAVHKLQQTPEFLPEKLGTCQIDGKKVTGFSAGYGNINFTIWADSKTALPVRIEFKTEQESWVMKNFEFDVPVDDSLISMEIPAGYTHEESQLDLSNVTEQDLIESLRIWAEVLMDGRFPPSITTEAFMKHVPMLEQKVSQLNLSKQQEEELGGSFFRGLMYIQMLDTNWHYTGDGVKLGNADTPVLWYLPKGSKTYRVIYGDLRVEDKEPQDLPK